MAVLRRTEISLMIRAEVLVNPGEIRPAGRWTVVNLAGATDLFCAVFCVVRCGLFFAMVVVVATRLSGLAYGVTCRS